MPIDWPTLTSTQNSRVKYARSLHVRKHRQQERAFIVEGARLFLDALDAGAIPLRVFVEFDRVGDDVVAALETTAASNIPIHACNSSVIKAVSDTTTPQGIVGIFSFPELRLNDTQFAPLFVVADGLKDPGNLGTLMRSALGAGVTALFTSSESVDPFSPKVVRAGMGAHFRLPVRFLDWDSVPAALVECRLKARAEADCGHGYDELDWASSAVLVVGSETGGISPGAHEFAETAVSIPLQGHVESLNAAVAGAVILFEAARQRRTQ